MSLTICNGPKSYISPAEPNKYIEIETQWVCLSCLENISAFQSVDLSKPVAFSSNMLLEWLLLVWFSCLCTGSCSKLSGLRRQENSSELCSELGIYWKKKQPSFLCVFLPRDLRTHSVVLYNFSLADSELAARQSQCAGGENTMPASVNSDDAGDLGSRTFLVSARVCPIWDNCERVLLGTQELGCSWSLLAISSSR